jgi:hypothetical protein
MSVLEAARHIAFVLNQAADEVDKQAEGEKPGITRH